MNIVEIYKKFPDHKACLEHLEKVRWNDQPRCSYCNSTNSTPLKNELRHHCNNCNTSYSVTVGTIFHNTKLDLQKWFLALSLMLNAKKGMAARQLARHIEVNRNTAWYMNMRIRKAMVFQSSRDLLAGLIEMDETYIGGKPRKGSGKKHKRGRGTSKTPVVGMVERKGEVKAKIVKKSNLNLKGLSSLVRENVDTVNSILITDEYRGYSGIDKIIGHQTVNHQIWYVDGDLHTNTIEGFWSLLKRGIVGQYHKVSIRHLQKYIDEFCFRYNNRNNNEIFDLTVSRALGVI